MSEGPSKEPKEGPMEGTRRVLRVVPARWQSDEERAAIVAIRREVFVLEQQVPVEIELDGKDPDCQHLLALDPAGQPIGTARMQAKGHVGRIAVVRSWRGRGVGARLVDAMVERARRDGLESVDLDAQTHAQGFYEKLGFSCRGETFTEAGIPHQNMVRVLR